MLAAKAKAMSDFLFQHARILIFCKAPVPGTVKTRLIPTMGIAGATQLHEALARRVVEWCQASRLAPIQLWCAPDITHEFFSSTGLDCRQQMDGHLGQRMDHALTVALSESDVDSAILIGTDCINMNSVYLHEALARLQHAKAVLGPAEDGGYGLIGLTEPATSVFDNLAWGTDSVCAETARRLNERFELWELLPLVWDLDRPEDLLRYRSWLESGSG